MDNLELKSTDELSQMLSDWDKKKIEAEHNLSLIEQEDLQLSRQIRELQLKRTDFSINIVKGKEIVKRLGYEYKIIERMFWGKRRQ